MSRRKLAKKDLEQLLNHNGDALALLEGMDLSGMDDYFEAWKAQRKTEPATKEALRHCNPSQFGTWLRARSREAGNYEFERRYIHWVGTHA